MLIIPDPYCLVWTFWCGLSTQTPMWFCHSKQRTTYGKDQASGNFGFVGMHYIRDRVQVWEYCPWKRACMGESWHLCLYHVLIMSLQIKAGLPAKKHACLFWSWDQTQAPMHNKQVLLTTELHPSPGMASLYVILPLKIQAYTEGLCFQPLLLYTITHKSKCRLSMSSLCVPRIPVSIFKNDLPFVSNVLLNSISSPLFRIPLSPSFLRANMLFFCIQIWIILQSPA